MSLALRRRAMGAPAVAGPLVSDDFSEPDGTNLHLKATDTPGVSWSVLNGAFAVQGGAVKSTGTSGEQRAAVTAGSVYGAVEARVTASAVRDDGILGRFDTAGGKFYMWRIGASAIELYKQAGGWTLLGSYSFTATAGVVYTLKMTLAGSTIKGFLDGVERVSVTDTAIADTVTGAGLRLMRNDALVDDFKVTA